MQEFINNKNITEIWPKRQQKKHTHFRKPLSDSTWTHRDTLTCHGTISFKCFNGPVSHANHKHGSLKATHALSRDPGFFWRFTSYSCPVAIYIILYPFTPGSSCLKDPWFPFICAIRWCLLALRAKLISLPSPPWQRLYIIIYLKPKWPLFWLEKTLFWRVQPPK